mgnify:CR=1 FL=1
MLYTSEKINAILFTMITNQDTRALGVRVPRKLIKQLKRVALEADKSLSEIITPMLETLVTRYESLKEQNGTSK